MQVYDLFIPYTTQADTYTKLPIERHRVHSLAHTHTYRSTLSHCVSIGAKIDWLRLFRLNGHMIRCSSRHFARFQRVTYKSENHFKRAQHKHNTQNTKREEQEAEETRQQQQQQQKKHKKKKKAKEKKSQSGGLAACLSSLKAKESKNMTSGSKIEPTYALTQTHTHYTPQ